MPDLYIEKPREPERFEVLLRDEDGDCRIPAKDDPPLIARAALEAMTPPERFACASAAWEALPPETRKEMLRGVESRVVQTAEKVEAERDTWKERAEKAETALVDMAARTEKAEAEVDKGRSELREMWKRAEKAEAVLANAHRTLCRGTHATAQANADCLVSAALSRSLDDIDEIRELRAELERTRERAEKAEARAEKWGRERDAAREAVRIVDDNLKEARAELERMRPVVSAAVEARNWYAHSDSDGHSHTRRLTEALMRIIRITEAVDALKPADGATDAACPNCHGTRQWWSTVDECYKGCTMCPKGGTDGA